MRIRGRHQICSGDFFCGIYNTTDLRQFFEFRAALFCRLNSYFVEDCHVSRIVKEIFMRKSLVIGCALLLAFTSFPLPEAEAGRFVVRRASRTFNRSFNQVQRNYRQASRDYSRAIRRAPVRRAPVYHAPSFRSYRAPVYRSGIYLGGQRGGIFLNF